MLKQHYRNLPIPYRPTTVTELTKISRWPTLTDRSMPLSLRLLLQNTGKLVQSMSCGWSYTPLSLS
jgi:hypothetical protein